VQTYAYIALEPTGRKRTGFVEAADRETAMAQVTADGRFVLELKEQAHKSDVVQQGVRGKVSRSDLALFTRRLADLSAAGLPLDRVLQVVSEQSESRQLSAVCQDALEEVRGGMAVSQALAKHTRYFSDMFTQTLRAGETGGQFPEVAGRLADFQEIEVTRRSQIISALIYPSVLLATAVGVIGVIVGFVMPRLSGVFKDLGGDLPITTKMLLGGTDFITSYWMWLLAGVVAAVVLYRTWSATEQGAFARDRVIVKIPLVGKIVFKAVVSRYARVLGTLVYGGVPILEGLRLAGLAAGNRVFRRSSEAVEQEVREGRPIAEAMRDTGVFPPVLTHMVAIGEETGDLPKMLGRVSDSLDFEVDNGMRRLTALIEPIIVLVMGAFVGFVVLSVLLPIYAAQSLVK
jgi:type II secretory pathway component PulF